MIKILVALIITFFCASCEKSYTCICTSIKSKQDSIVDQIKTTKLGSKGYKKTCANKVNTLLSNCEVE